MMPRMAWELWEEHQRAVFPPGLTGRAIEGVDLVLLDSAAAGCISSYFASGGRLDATRVEVLTQCVADLMRVIPQVNGEARTYFERLRTLADSVLSWTHT